jgi:hypothetical protein
MPDDRKTRQRGSNRKIRGWFYCDSCGGLFPLGKLLVRWSPGGALERLCEICRD